MAPPAGFTLRAPAVWSRDGAWVAVELWDETVRSSVGVWERATGHLVGTAVVPDFARGLHWLPDGRLLGRGSGAKRWVVDIGAGSVRADGVPEWWRDADAWTVVASPDGRTVAASTAEGTVLLWDVPPTKSEPADVERAWADLAGDALAAWRAVRALASPAGVDVLARAKRCEPIAAAEAAELLAKLDAKEFKVREAATRRLRRVRRGGGRRVASGPREVAVGRGEAARRGVARRPRPRQARDGRDAAEPAGGRGAGADRLAGR